MLREQGAAVLHSALNKKHSKKGPLECDRLQIADLRCSSLNSDLGC